MTDGDTLPRTARPKRLALVGSVDVREVRRNVTLSDRAIGTRRDLIDLGFGMPGEQGPLAITALVQHRSREFRARGEAIAGCVRYWTLQLMYRPSGG